jgi:hypothetical protein
MYAQSIRGGAGLGLALWLVSVLAAPVYGQKCCLVPVCPTAPSPAPATDPRPPDVTLPQPPQAEPPPAEAPAADPLAFGATGGGETFAAAAPQMVGDFFGYFGTTVGPTSTFVTRAPVFTITKVGKFGTLVTVTVRSTSQTTTQSITSTPVPSRVNFKVADNESPMPQDRAYVDVRDFYNVQSSSAFMGNQATLQPRLLPNGTVAFGPVGSGATTATNMHVNVVAETLGLEKTLFNGNVSVGIRVPFVQLQGSSATNTIPSSFFTGGLPAGAGTTPTIVSDQSSIADISILLKYALYSDRQAGNALSAGLVITTPTGRAIPTASGATLPVSVIGLGGSTLPTFQQSLINDVVLQPYFGGLYRFDRAYIQGFTSLAVPTSAQDVTLLFNDIGTGFWLYRSNSGLLTSVIPCFETHINTPLNHSQPGPSLYVPNIVDLTAGLHVGVGRRSLVTFALGTPVTGPRPFDLEAITQFNYRW